MDADKPKTTQFEKKKRGGRTGSQRKKNPHTDNQKSKVQYKNDQSAQPASSSKNDSCEPSES